MRACVIRRANSMDNRQPAFVIERLQGIQRRMKAEVSVQIDSTFGVLSNRVRYGNLWTKRSVVLVAERNDDRDAVRSTSLENGNDDRMIAAGRSVLRQSRAYQKGRSCCKGCQGQTTGLQKQASRHRHKHSLLLLKLRRSEHQCKGSGELIDGIT